MNREPKISEIQKLIDHFRNTDREDELFEVLEKHNIKGNDPEIVISEGTHEINEQAEVFGKIAKKEKLRIHHHRPFGKITDFIRYKWYVRYTAYYIMLFFAILAFLNAPILIEKTKAIDTSQAKLMTVQEVERYAMEKSAPLDPGEVVPAGSQLLIPKIGVTAPIVFTASNDEKTIQDNLTKGVVHYNGTAEPGTVGNSFITGHSSNFWWIKGSYNYIFVNLNKLAVGDQAKIYHNGNKYVYQVREVKVVEPSDTSVLATTDTPVLTLMTCTPTGTNWKRLIIVFDQISPKYVKPRTVTKQVVAMPDYLTSTDTNSTGGILLTISNGIKNLFGF